MKIAIIGYGGSGKSTLAAALGKHYQADAFLEDILRSEDGNADKGNQV